MKLRLYSSIRTTVAVIVLLMTSSLQAQTGLQADSPPYLYYYSAEQSAFIVERADGSDSRILTQFDEPEYTFVSGPGWSPSGNWFAWTISGDDGAAVHDTVAYVVNRNGEAAHSLIENSDEGVSRVDMFWSPIEDLLLVSSIQLNDEGNKAASEFFIYNPNQQTRVLNLQPQGAYQEWTPDGQYVVTYSTLGTMQLEDKKGNIVERTFYLPGDCPYAALPAWSTDGKVLSVTADTQFITIEDFGSGTADMMSAPAGIIRVIDWSPDGQYALLYTTENCTSESSSLWLVNIRDKSILPVGNDLQFRLPDIRQRLAYTRFTNDYNFYAHSVWDRSSRYAWAISIQNEVYLIHADGDEPDKISGIGEVERGLTIWSAYDPLKLLLVQTRPEHQIFGYTIVDGTPTMLLAQAMSEGETIRHLALSADERYIGFSTNDIIQIVDLINGQTTSIHLADMNHGLVSNAELYWHFKQDWLLANSILTSAQLRMVKVLNVTGSIQRELCVCSITPSGSGWLPEAAG